VTDAQDQSHANNGEGSPATPNAAATGDKPNGATAASIPAALPELAGAQTYWEDRDTLVYALRCADGVRYITSTRQEVTADQARQRYTIVSTPSRRTRFSRDAVGRFVRGEAPVDPAALFSELTALFRDHVYWHSPHTPALLAVWTMATYVFQVFTYFPYLALNSAEKRSGKSLVLAILYEVAFNATQPLHGATPATIFRDIHANDSTCLLDEVETLTDADKANKSQMLAVLCGGFKRGAAVPRCEPGQGGKGYTTPTEYAVYSPKVLAGINEVADVIRDRAINVRMIRRPAGSTHTRFDVRALTPRLLCLRDALHVFGLTCAGAIVEAYGNADTLPVPAGLDDRGRDICEPLFAVARVIGPDAERELTAAVEEIAAKRRADDASSEGELPAARAVLLAHLDSEGTDEVVLRSDEALGVFRLAGVFGMEGGERDAQALLRRLGFYSGTHRRDGSPMRGYKISRAALQGGPDAA
jgi:hypothetical protein